MAGSVTITISGLDTGHVLEFNQAALERMEAVARVKKLLNGVVNGVYPATVTLNVSTADAVRAAGTLTLSSGSGAVGGVINGTTVTDTWASSDANSAGLIAAAINANTTVNKFVSASASGAVVTVIAHEPGKSGSAITFAASGTGVTATGSGKLSNTGTVGAGADAAPVVFSLS